MGKKGTNREDREGRWQGLGTHWNKVSGVQVSESHNETYYSVPNCKQFKDTGLVSLLAHHNECLRCLPMSSLLGSDDPINHTTFLY